MEATPPSRVCCATARSSASPDSGIPDLLSLIRGGTAALATGPGLGCGGARGRHCAARERPASGAASPPAEDHLRRPELQRPRRGDQHAAPLRPDHFRQVPDRRHRPRGDSIVLPKSSTRPDYEAEFAFVIGEGGRHIPASEWREHVFGYTMLNDVSARDYQMATSQWMMGKTFDTFAPMGPWIVTADEIADPHALDISLTLNGELMQNSNTRNLIFRIPELIAFLSSVFTLEPGDVVSTGTPAGVGFARKPPVYLQPGDEVVVRVEGLGELRNPVVAETV